MKTGILYPRSNAHPGMMMDFMDGIKVMLKEHQLDNEIQLISESIGFGGNEKEVYEKAEKLLVLEDVDVLVAFVDLRVLELLKPLLFASGKLAVVVHAGANYPHNWAPQPNILNLTLHHAFLCWLTGQLAGDSNHKNALVATSFYDCGYLHIASFVKGFEKAGGAVSFNYVNNQRYDDGFNIPEVKDFLSADSGTQSLLCVFDSLPASLFYDRVNKLGFAEDLRLFVSPMMLEAKALAHIGEGFKFPIQGYLSWSPTLQNKANGSFIEFYRRHTKREPTSFSLLGWEAALVLQQVFSDFRNARDVESVAAKLNGITIKSPRGEMKLDEATNYFVSPVIKCTISPHSNTIDFETTGHLQTQWEAFIHEPVEGATSGWTNTYLCY